jgi:hypothetical protein
MRKEYPIGKLRRFNLAQEISATCILHARHFIISVKFNTKCFIKAISD